MKSTPEVVRYTPAMLKAVCKREKISKKKFRLTTLEQIATDLDNLLGEPAGPMHEADRDLLAEMLQRVRLALGNE